MELRTPISQIGNVGSSPAEGIIPAKCTVMSLRGTARSKESDSPLAWLLDRSTVCGSTPTRSNDVTGRVLADVMSGAPACRLVLFQPRCLW